MIRKFVSDFERKFRPVHPAAKSYCLDSKRQERDVHNMFIETTMDNPYLNFAPLLASRNIAALVPEKKTQSFVIGDTGVTRYPKAKHDLRHQDTKLLYPISWDVVLAWGFPQNSKNMISIPYDEMRIANELTLNQSDIIAGSSKELIESLSRKTKRV
ncbi:MAG: hypothetical protein OXD43_10005 [Bacteroidetes bacterium]|nr:hypothetical protein [Bacteroidota bacterium]